MKNTFRKIEASFEWLHYKFYNWNQKERTKNQIKQDQKPENQKYTEKEEVEIVRMKNTFRKIEASFEWLHYKFYNWNQEERIGNKNKRGQKPKTQTK